MVATRERNEPCAADVGGQESPLIKRHDAVMRFYRNAHLYVQSSQHEGGGMSVLEAAAARLPIVGTRVGYVSDLEPHAAVAVQPADAHGLADAIVRTLRDAMGRKTISARARQFAETYDADWSAQQLLALYASVSARS